MQALVLTQKKDFNKIYTRPSVLTPQLSCRMANEISKSPLQPMSTRSLLRTTKGDASPEEISKKKLYLDWIRGIAFIKFDIDQGNMVEAIYPGEILSKSEQKTISLLAFPDSNSFSAEGGIKFVFRLKRDTASANDDVGSLFGYVYFRQKRDPANPRGFSQKSLVILSILPFTEFFKNVLDILGPIYFDQGNTFDSEQFLKDNYNIMLNEWAKPQPGVQHELELHGRNLTMSIPKNICESKHIDLQERTKVDKHPPEQKSFGSEDSPYKESGLPSSRISSRLETEDDENREQPLSPERDQSLSSILCGFNLQEKGFFQDINLYKIFKGDKLPYLWKLWEIVLTNQPLMIMSDLPSECSEAVLGLLSIICPLEYQTDYKPYFTIFDPEYKEIHALYEKKVARCAIMGVTNPLFLKVMPNYPNVFHLEKGYLAQKKNKSSKKISLLEGTQTQYTLPDPSLKKMLIPTESQETDAINNVLLRKSLQKLTESFLSIFEIYFKLQINDIKKFEEKDFMKFLELQKFPFKAHFEKQAHILKVYSNFVKSANFTHYVKTFSNVYVVKSV